MHLTPEQCQDQLQAVLDSLVVLGEDLEQMGQQQAANTVWAAVEDVCQGAANISAAMWSVTL